ncbi:bifunctional DNA primase/polymerase [Pseudoroseomonas globiformis]|uniref:Bifunctional DNA primase/polymerase n=1 Tax=Teichococcus globiformis TaxID=2307229 RepID=A0ABV7G267_9PROT
MPVANERASRLVAEAALAYARHGWPAVPVYTVRPNGSCSCGRPTCTKAGKHPNARRGYHDASTDPMVIRRAFLRDANVGVAVGLAAGVWVLDVDGTAGEAALAELAARHGPLPDTIEAVTGGGGRHLYFRYPTGRRVRNTVRSLGPGLDTRSDGGGVVAPPSRHASGNIYRWLDGHAPGEIQPAEAPTWILDMLEPRGPAAPQIAQPAADANTAQDAYAASALDGEILKVMRAQEGTRNATLNTAAVKLGSLVGAGTLQRGVVEAELIRAALACRLPLPEIQATLRSGLEHGISTPRNMDGVGTTSETRRRAVNHEAQMARRKRLQDNPKAVAWLTETNGLTRATLDHFGFGLDKPYQSRKTGKVYADALTFPLRGSDGTALGLICKAEVPGVTALARAAWWSAGTEDATFYATPQTGQGTVVVCDMPDLWRLWQELDAGDGGTAPQIVASSSAEGCPPEWDEPGFWDRWDEILVASPDDERGDALAVQVHRSAGKPVRRLRPPGESWRGAFAAGAAAADFQAAAAAAEPMVDSARVEDDGKPGRKAFRPLDIGRAFHNGHLYYAVETLFSRVENDENGNPELRERRDTVVIRSDGQMLHSVAMPAPKGTPPDRRVMRLSDGTLIDSEPKAPAHPSWSWPSIQRWLDAKKRGEAVQHRPFDAILEDVRTLFRRAVWLPYEEDYMVLALTCCASFSQAVFQAVPLILLCGPSNTGKSTAGVLMGTLAANGTIVGQVSAAAAARLIHETKGLVVLDDLEAIGAKPGKDGAAFGDLVQWLKVSYNRDTATKVWVDSSRNFKVERLNGFGIKVINNTTGVDSILGSRMIRVQSRKMPQARADERRGMEPPSSSEIVRLRDELHCWTFDHVGRIAQVYAGVCPSASERAEEIAAPLRVLARISGNKEHAASLEAALTRTAKSGFEADDPAEVLQEAAVGLARQGYRQISPTHLILEMKRLVEQHFGQSSTSDIPEYQQPEWVGRTLRLRDIIEPGAPATRQRLYGRNLRIYPFGRNFLADVMDDLEAVAPKAATDFCAGCEGCDVCPYRTLGCPLMEERLAADKAKRWRRRDL